VSEIRNVELGTFLASADAAARVRRAAEQVQGRDDRRDHPGEQRGGDQHGEGQHEPGTAARKEDLVTGAYDDHGRRDDVNSPHTQGNDGDDDIPKRLDLVV
jgi:hypothetical protein